MANNNHRSFCLYVNCCVVFAPYKGKNVQSICEKRCWFTFGITFCFAAVCPFLTLPKPLYVAILTTNNPFTPKTSPINISRRTIATLFQVSHLDGIREWIAFQLSDHYPGNFRILRRTDKNPDSYYSLPLLKMFTMDTKEVGRVVWKRSIYLPSSVLSRDIRLHFPQAPALQLTSEKGKMEFGINGWIGGWVFNFAYTQYPETYPWDAVVFQKEQEDSAY